VLIREQEKEKKEISPERISCLSGIRRNAIFILKKVLKKSLIIWKVK
jgi:hypothetical protein